MSVLNPLARELSAKIVFYGPGLSGKTSSLQYIHSTLHSTLRGELLSLATEGDRTLFFDFLPVQVPKIHGLGLRLQLYTVPGQVFYGATRQLVLDGADGVVFVADSQTAAHERNLESLDDLRSNLRRLGTSLDDLPFVLQYNKRDLPDVLSVEQLRRELNPSGAPDFETCASTGQGVTAALKAIIRKVSQHLTDRETKSRPGSERGTKRLTLSTEALSERGESCAPGGIASQVTDAIEHLGPSLRSPPPPRIASPLTTPRTLHAPVPRAELPHDDEQEDDDAPPEREVKTIQAPAAAPFSFSTLWDDPRLLQTIEADIATGHFAEAVHRAASGVSEILDGLLGPHVLEGTSTRAQLLGLDGREYLELRRLASRPASAITQNEALFALYLLIAARVKETRLAPY